MPGIHSFDHLVVRVEDFDAGVAAFSDLAGLAHRESCLLYTSDAADE